MKKFLAILAGIVALAVTATPSFAGEYWKDWPVINRLDMFPECGVNVLAAGGDDVLQETVDAYCGVKPGGYVVYINPKQHDHYKKFKRGKDKYADGKLAVIVFKAGIAFTTEIKNGKPIMDVIALKDGKSIASKEKGHILNPETCFNCHETSQDGVCKKQGYLCADVSYRSMTK